MQQIAQTISDTNNKLLLNKFVVVVTKGNNLNAFFATNSNYILCEI